MCIHGWTERGVTNLSRRLSVPSVRVGTGRFVMLDRLSTRTCRVSTSSSAGSVGKDYKVYLWSLADPARPAGVNSVAFSPDGKILAGNTGDGSMWLWTLADPAHPALLGQPLTGPASVIGSIAFSPDGQTLAAGTGDGTAQMWNLNVDDAVQRICASTSNTLTPVRWKQYLVQLPYNPPCARPGHYGLLSQ